MVDIDFENKIKSIDDKFNQKIIDLEDNEKIAYLIGREKVYKITNSNVINQLRKDVVNAKYIKGIPNGKLSICFVNGIKWNINNVVEGRVFDFVQELHPREINEAGYDNTIRGEFPQLLDPDHAIEIDKLRKYMQAGNISHYEFDDYNPVYPKAGK